MRSFGVFTSSSSTIWTKSYIIFFSNFDNLLNVVLVLCSFDMRTCSFSSVNLRYLFLSQIADVSGIVEFFFAHKASSFPAVLVFAVKQSGVVLAAPDFKNNHNEDSFSLRPRLSLSLGRGTFKSKNICFEIKQKIIIFSAFDMPADILFIMNLFT